MRRDARNEWRSGWPFVLCGTSGLYAAVLYVYSFGLFIRPLHEEFGWALTDISAGMLIVSFAAVIGNPLIGLFLDRFGPGRIAVLGAASYAAAFASLGTVGSTAGQWRLHWVLIAIASLGICVPVWLVGVARRFDRARGLAMACGYLGSSLAALTIPYLTYRLIETFGWRHAYFALGTIALIVGGVPALFLHFRDRDGKRADRPASRAGGEQRLASLKSVSRSTVFWRLCAISLAVTIGVMSLIVHMVSILGERSIPRGTAAALAGLIGLAGFAGRLITGALLDRFPAPQVGVVIYSLVAMSCGVLLPSNFDVYRAVLITVAIGFCLGAELDIMAYLCARLFGLASFGALFGVLTGIISLGAGLGPVVGAAIREHGGSYVPLAYLCLMLFAGSAACLWTLSGEQPN